MPAEKAAPPTWRCAYRASWSNPKRGNPPRSGSYSSSYRGVIHHRRSQRYEAHIWSEGKQTYLGGFDSEHEAAIAYDLAAIKFRGQGAIANFDVSKYASELASLDSITREELVQQLRNQGKGGQTKTSRFRGVMKHAKGKWEARIGHLSGGKYQYLGLFGTEIDAAVAYDRALVAQKGLEAETNFALENYEDMLGWYKYAAVLFAGDHSASEIKAACAQWHDNHGADASPVPAAAGAAHDWMHHFHTFRRQQAQAAAADARRRSSSGAPSVGGHGAAASPPTFKRFFDGHDESAFAQLPGFKHLRGSDGSPLPVSSLVDAVDRVGAGHVHAGDGSASGGDTNRTYSEGAALGAAAKMDAISPSEAAVIELFVSAQRPPSGPALSAPAQLDDRLGRTASDQTHSHGFGDGASPMQEALATPARSVLGNAMAVSPPTSGDAHGQAVRASPLSQLPQSHAHPPHQVPPVPLFRATPHSAAHASQGADATDPGLQQQPSLAELPTQAQRHGGAPAALAHVADAGWRQRYGQLQEHASRSNALPDAGELGQWCSQQLDAALGVAAGYPLATNPMTRDQYLALASLRPFAERLAFLERTVFAECLARLQRFAHEQGRMPSRLLAHIAAPERQTAEKELADWSTLQRRLAIKFAVGLECGQMCKERILALMQVPGWLDSQN